MIYPDYAFDVYQCLPLSSSSDNGDGNANSSGNDGDGSNSGDGSNNGDASDNDDGSDNGDGDGGDDNGDGDNSNVVVSNEDVANGDGDYDPYDNFDLSQVCQN